MFSIISVYHNKEILERYLLKSLESQSANYELILIDNTKMQFKSIAEALNYGARQIKSQSKYIMFVHPDVDLCTNTWLENAEKILDSLPNLGTTGVAGMSEEGGSNKERGRNIIKHNNPPIIWPWGNPIKKPEPVQTLDECLLIIPKSVFNILQFDEKTCDDWHLYAVDYCLSCKRLGFEAYAIPMFIYHRSASLSKYRKSKIQILKSLGPLPESYYQTLEKLLKKHKNYFRRIYTTCGDWSTSYPLILQRILPLAKAGARLILRKFKSNKKNELSKSFNNNS